jgi:hypothetical protein
MALLAQLVSRLLLVEALIGQISAQLSILYSFTGFGNCKCTHGSQTLNHELGAYHKADTDTQGLFRSQSLTFLPNGLLTTTNQ